jgi:hypothetical protein
LPTCDHCNRTIKLRQHEGLLRDLETSQQVGVYHIPGCAEAAAKYFSTGIPMRLTIRHPPQCAPQYGYCADRLGTDPAILLYMNKDSA